MMRPDDLINGEDVPLDEADHIDHAAIERGMSAVAALRHRNEVLERMTNDAVLALKGRDVELETLRLAIAERDNRIASIQSSCDERVAAVQAERDALVNEAAELRSIFANIKYVFERIELPLPRLPAPAIEAKSIKRRRNGDEQPVTGK